MKELLIVCPLVFLAALVDSIAGGGGIISLSAYQLAGLPPHVALGTNKFSSTVATSVSAFRFARGGSIHFPTAAASALFALIGSALGARLALFLSERVLQIVLMVLLPIATVFILTRKTLSDEESGKTLSGGKAMAACGAIGLVIGCYDGFFGPGTGTFLILAFVFFVGMPLRNAMGNAKVVNLASNVAALLTLGSQGKVVLWIGIPAAVCGMLGGYLGSGLALKNGAKIFRPVLLVVMALLLVKLLLDLLG